MSFFVPLLHNAALLVALVLTFDMLAGHARKHHRGLWQVAVGALVGLLGISIMSAPLSLDRGIIFDSRSVLLSLTGLFFGGVPTAVALVVTVAYRFFLGGVGMWTGVAVLICSGSLGLLWRWRRHTTLQALRVRELYLLGLCTHAIMLALMLTLPGGMVGHVLQSIAMPVIVIFPVATALLGWLLVNRLRRHLLVHSNELTQLQLQQAHAELEATFRAIPDLLFELDGEGRYLAVTAQNPELLYRPATQLLGQTVHAVLPPDAAQVVLQSLADAARSGHASGRRYRLALPQGLTWFELSVARKSPSQPHAPGRFVVLARDVTEQHAHEARDRLAATVFSASQEAITITDAHNRILEVNPAFTRITGYERSEVVGLNPRVLSSGRQPPEFYADMYDRLQREGRWQGEIWNRRKSGEIYAELLSIDTVRDTQGQLTHHVAVFSDISHIKSHQAELDHMAHFDILTGLPNRRLLGDRLEMAVARARRENHLLAVCYIDLDEFKQVNDRWSHAVGDQVLVHLGHHLQRLVRDSDTVARIGGDEFVLLLEDMGSTREFSAVLDRLLRWISTPQQVEGHEVRVSASIGVTVYPDDNVNADTLLRHADQAMFLAKQQGRNRYQIFDARQEQEVREHQALLTQIERGLQQQEFRLYYQPKVDMVQGRVLGVEALIRWQHPEDGLWPPGRFMPAVEHSELELPVGEWVIEEAWRQAQAWQAQGLDLPISVNVTAGHLQTPGFVDFLRALLARAPQLPPGSLGLEVLETATLDDIDAVARLVTQCQAMGLPCALDDFGTGYSTLTYLRRLPTRVLKIDQSFVRDMLDDPNDLAIVAGVIGLSKAFGREVIAEGVESVEVGSALISLGCTQAQGYGVSRPMPAADVPAWVAQWQARREWQVNATT